MQPKSQYKKLYSFAFIPSAILTLSKGCVNVENEHLQAYLCFSFDRATEINVVETEQYAVFAPGLKNFQSEELYCYFELNRNQKQRWALVRIDTASGISSLQSKVVFPEPVAAMADFNKQLHDFAYMPKHKLESVAQYIQCSTTEAYSHIAHVYDIANRYGFIAYENDMALFHTGISSESESIYALFKANRNNMQPWFLVGFLKRKEIKGITYYPAYFGEEAYLPEVPVTPNSQRIRNQRKHMKKTLIVTAVQTEYDALIDVLKEKNINYEENTTTEICDRELRYLYIEQFNTYAILAGKSFECMIPLMQCILYLKPDQAILAGIAFSFDIQKAPFNSLVISEQVWDYESTKINENNETYWRGEKISSSPELRRIFNETVDRQHLKRTGIYASGMKLVNSVEFQDAMRGHQTELLAGDQEGYFFAHTCNFFRLNWIVVKAISDYGYKKDDSGQATAAFTALAFVISAIANS